jgi:hypothetical protein
MSAISPGHLRHRYMRKPLGFVERDGVYEQRYTDFNTSRSP